MKKRLSILLLAISVCLTAAGQQSTLPHLEKRGQATQLIVDGEPFLMLGGELGNSSVSTPHYMAQRWERLTAMGLNTVLAPVYWELIEPEEGKFDFSSVDQLIADARKHNLKLVPLWFGSWKNSMSCYAPGWMKRQFNKRFPLARTSDGKAHEILSAFSTESAKADARAFAALMGHIKKVDQNDRTVILVQVENEIGMIGNAREYGKQAEKAFNSPVPAQVMEYIVAKKQACQKRLYDLWTAGGSKTKGTWKEVFGESLDAQEMFQAYHYGLYVEQVTRAGRAAYDLPMYLNAALDSRGRKAGAYPAAGPLSHLKDMWTIAAPSIDMLSPDIYDPGFCDWIARYDMPSNPLFIPEIRGAKENAARVFYALGAHKAMGFSPFSIEDEQQGENYPLAKAYRLLAHLTPEITLAQAQGRIYGVWFDADSTQTTLEIGKVKFTLKHDLTLGWDAEAKDKSKWSECAALVIDRGNDEFLFAGTGVVVTMESLEKGKMAGISAIDELVIQQNEAVVWRRMNGDQDHQGRHLRIPFGSFGMQNLKVYFCPE